MERKIVYERPFQHREGEAAYGRMSGRKLFIFALNRYRYDDHLLMKKTLVRIAAVGAALAFFGAGCASKTPLPTPAPETPFPSAQAPAPEDSEDIDRLIQEAQQEDQAATQNDERAQQLEIQQQESSAIETPEAEGVSY